MLAAAAMLLGCGQPSGGSPAGGGGGGGGGGAATSPPASAAGPLRVVATSGVLAELASWLLGDAGQVQQWMGDAVDPHRFAPRRTHLHQLRQAGFLLLHGPGIEAGLQGVVEGLGQRIPVCAVVDLGAPGAPANGALASDPHGWHDPGLWAVVVQSVAERLAPLVADPEAVRHRAMARADALRQLAREARQRFAGLPPGNRLLVTAHDGFQHLGHALALATCSVSGSTTALEPGLGHLADLVQRLVAQRVPAVFAELGVPDAMLRQLAARAGAQGQPVRICGPLLGNPNAVPGPPILNGVAAAEGRAAALFRANCAIIWDGLAGGEGSGTAHGEAAK